MGIKRTPAFTIIETIVALLIIVTIFAIVTLSFTRTMDSNNLNEKLEAHIIVIDYAIRTKTEKDFINASIESNKFSLNREIDYYQNNKSLLHLTITAKNNRGKVIDTYREIILLTDEKN